MRIEKGFLDWKADLLTEFDPFETGLDRFVDLGKDFVGCEALRARRQRGPKRKRVTLEVASAVAPAHGGASLMSGGAVVGTITSGDWGHRVGKNLAYGFVAPDYAMGGTALTLDLCGALVGATVIDDGPYDPAFSLLRL